MTCFHSPVSTQFPASFLQSIPENNDDLGSEITRLAGHINAANYRFLTLLAALVERGAWSGHGIKSPAHWLNYYCGISLGPAREKVRVALALKSLPLIDAAFAKGEISYSKVRAMTRAATPKNEDYLLMIARFGTASHLETLVRKYQRVERLCNDEHGKAQHEAREFCYYYDDDGMLVFKGRLVPEDGAVFLKAMDAVLHKMNEATFPRERAGGGGRCSDGCQSHDSETDDADEALERNESKHVSAETSLATSPESCQQKRADALVRMAEHTLATTTVGDGPAPLKGGDKYQVVVHINAGHGGGSPTPTPVKPFAWIENGPALAPAAVKRLASDASLVTVLEDDDGGVLNVGRKTRTIPASIRRALGIRDGGCRFPGCCESKYVDAHHIHHWCDRGETRLDNLVLLCRRHHRLVHEEGYGITVTGDGDVKFTSPGGQTLPRAVYPQFDDDGVRLMNPVPGKKDVSAETSLAIERQHQALDLAIDAGTAVAAWRGESMDYDLGVAALQRRNASTSPNGNRLS